MKQQSPDFKTSWIYKHKLLTSLIAGFLVLIGAGLGNHTPAPVVDVKGIAISVAPTAVPTQLPTNTPIPTASPSPTLTPTATPTPSPLVKQASVQTTQNATNQQQGLSNNSYYENSSGNEVHSPAYSADDSVPAGASAKCSDGTYSFSQHHSGTCSHHGGVTQWL